LTALRASDLKLKAEKGIQVVTALQRKAQALAKLDEAARAHQRRNPELTYSQAYAEILRRYPKTYGIVREAVSKGIS
jgi:hypothetical protein